jgi:hypothetical protein
MELLIQELTREISDDLLRNFLSVVLLEEEWIQV